MDANWIAGIEERAGRVTGEWRLRCIDSGLPEATTFDDGTPHTFMPRYFKYVDGIQVFCAAYSVDGLDTLGDHECGAMEKDSAEFVFHARQDIPALIAEVRRLQEKLGQARDRHADIVEHSYREFDGHGKDPRLDACRSTLAAIIRSDLG